MHMFLYFASYFMVKKGQFSGAPTFLDPVASSSQWFYFAVVVSPVGKRPVLVTQQCGRHSSVIFRGSLCYLQYCLTESRGGTIST
jgi:hypothetical protein